MNQYKKLLGNTFAMMIGSFSSKILVFLMLPLYTACLSTEEYGTVDLIFTTVNLLYPLLTLLASDIALRFALDENADKGKILTICTKIHIAGFVLILLLSPLFKLIPQLYEYKYIFFVYYFCNTFSSTLMQFTKGCNAVKEFAVAGFIKTFVTVVLNIIFLLCLNMGIIGYLYAYISADVVTIVFFFIKLKLYKYIHLFSKTDISLLKNMLSYSIPLIPNSMCWWINNSLDRYVLLFFADVSAIGIYSAANKIPAILVTCSTIFINAWQISAVEDFGSEKNRVFFSEIYKKYSTFIICATAIGIMLAEIIAKILLDAKFVGADKLAQILMLAFVFHTMSTFLGSVFTASKKTRTLFFSTLFGAVVNLVFNFLLIPKWGSIGAAAATSLSYISVWVYSLYLSRKIIKLSINLRKDIICYILLLIECIVMVSAIKYYNYILSFLLTIVIYILNCKEIKDIISIKKLKNILAKK